MMVRAPNLGANQPVKRGFGRSRMTRLVIAGAMISGLALIACPAGYAKPSQRATHRAARPDPIKNAVLAIALNSADPQANLHQACGASDFKVLAWGLEGIRSRISLTKGEFETDAEFAERTGKIEGALNGQARIIVCQPLDDNEDAPFQYDPERQVFKGSFRSNQNVWRDVKRIGSYVSRTRMGVRAKVSASTELEYNVNMGDSLRPVGRTCGKDEFLSYSYEVPVPRSKAPAVKSNGYLVFIGRLVSPFIDSADTPGSPTLDDPHDVYERDLTVHFAPTEITLIGPSGSRLWECKLG